MKNDLWAATQQPEADAQVGAEVDVQVDMADAPRSQLLSRMTPRWSAEVHRALSALPSTGLAG